MNKVQKEIREQIKREDARLKASEIAEEQGHRCRGCIWATRVDKNTIFCPLPRCVRGVR